MLLRIASLSCAWFLPCKALVEEGDGSGADAVIAQLQHDRQDEGQIFLLTPDRGRFWRLQYNEVPFQLLVACDQGSIRLSRIQSILPSCASGLARHPAGSWRPESHSAREGVGLRDRVGWEAVEDQEWHQTCFLFGFSLVTFLSSHNQGWWWWLSGWSNRLVI